LEENCGGTQLARETPEKVPEKANKEKRPVQERRILEQQTATFSLLYFSFGLDGLSAVQ
jgi:hypothetical protein